ncbi:hypothetical protein AVEN_45700-1 [Araneus ventricosus]|uniref:Uncharacterized protein n=1 Tax=Araneus ventricosus TaxID=182803 RepID=A0A4Y2C6D6_ARAVE|nr:hypothetical protein AVEN_45700-1 [Araneus ventricosus]
MNKEQTKHNIVHKHSNTSVFVAFGYHQFWFLSIVSAKKFVLDFIHMQDLAANFEKTKGESARLGRSKTRLKNVCPKPNIMQRQKFSSDNKSNCDETGLFRKKMQKEVHFTGGKGTART